MFCGTLFGYPPVWADLFSNIPMWQLCLFATDVCAYAYKHSCVDKCTLCELTWTQAGLQHGCLHFDFYFDTYKMWQTVESENIYQISGWEKRYHHTCLPNCFLPDANPLLSLMISPIVPASSIYWDLHCYWAAPSGKAWVDLWNSAKAQLLSITSLCLQNQSQMGRLTHFQIRLRQCRVLTLRKPLRSLHFSDAGLFLITAVFSSPRTSLSCPRKAKEQNFHFSVTVSLAQLSSWSAHSSCGPEGTKTAFLLATIKDISR